MYLLFGAFDTAGIVLENMYCLVSSSELWILITICGNAGHSVNTYTFINAEGKESLVKLHFNPVKGTCMGIPSEYVPFWRACWTVWHRSRSSCT